MRAVPTGIGDDCAVLRPRTGHDTLVTTDFTLEGIHFRREWHPPESVGHRCLARGLSDIAAMGGEPVAFFLSLALPRNLPQSWVSHFARGLLALADKYGVTLAGGDTAESPGGILADIIVIGTVPKGKAILRSGARPGDQIYVSGELGASAAALQQLRRHDCERDSNEHRRSSGEARACPERTRGNEGESNGDLAWTAHEAENKPTRDYPRHFYPDPRLALGRLLREEGLASAMIDTSDGLSTDLAHISEESRVGAEIESALVPRACVGRPAREASLDLALHGGEDYELLFTAPRTKRIPGQIAGVPLTMIGHITRQPKILLRDVHGIARRLVPHGWEHFR